MKRIITLAMAVLALHGFIHAQSVKEFKTECDSLQARLQRRTSVKASVSATKVERQGNTLSFHFNQSLGDFPWRTEDAEWFISQLKELLPSAYKSCKVGKVFVGTGKALLDQGMEELIVDLRDNTGGYFNQALGLSNLFLDKGDEIVYMQGLHRPKENFTADGKGFLKGVRLKVLINESSASSSEIFAGAMQDNDRGLIIGRRSFGKGLVQEPLNFNDGSGIRLTAESLNSLKKFV